MASTGKQDPKTSIGIKFRQQMEQLATWAEQQASQAVENLKPGFWYRPEGFTADLFDLPAYHEPFLRKQQEDECMKAVKDSNSPGTSGDLQMVVLQGDMMQTLERAFRARHHSAVRTRVHPGARLLGHGTSAGVIRNGMLGYIVNVDKHNKGEIAGTYTGDVNVPTFPVV